MKEIVKVINDTNASFRALTAGNAKNTDLFLDNEYYELFKNEEKSIIVRFSKNNLTQAILFISSILPRKYDSSSVHKQINFSTQFVYEQLAMLDGLFSKDDKATEYYTQKWEIRKDVEKKNGEIDSRFYFKNLLSNFEYHLKGQRKPGKFTVRNYLAAGYSKLHIIKANDGVFDVWIENAIVPNAETYSIPVQTSSSPLQLIYFGTPGSGKSHKVKDIIEKKVPEGEIEHRVFRTTFHPDSDYASFVGCYKPSMHGSDITYEFTPQVFTKAYVQAWKKQAEAIEQEKKQAVDVYLVIEEINRGNCAQIFGDLFQILDRDKDGVSEYGITPDVDLLAYLKSQLPKDSQGLAKKQLRLPANLHILATMNTSDQSLFPMDSAFKRRWDWEYVPIDYSDNVDSSKFEISIGDEKDKKTYRWVDFLKAVNARIFSATDSEDKQMGNFFIKHSVEEKEFKSKVMFYLWHEVCKDEYHTQNNFFRTLENQEEKEFSFNQLHEKNGTSLLEGFMQYLGVKTLDEIPSQEGDGTPNEAGEDKVEE